MTRDCSVEMTPSLRKIRAKNFANFPEFRHVPARKNCMHSAGVRCAYFTTWLRVFRVSIAFRSEKESVQRRDHANFAPNSRERIAKFPKKFGAPRAQKLRELGQRGCANRRTSLQLFSESAYTQRKITRESSVEMTQILRKKSRENFAKFREIRHAPRTKKIMCTRPACAAHTSQRR